MVNRATPSLPLRLAIVFVTVTVLVSASPRHNVVDAAQPAVVHQLRIYEIFEGNKQAFHDRFRDHAMRIMTRYDFKIVAMWETRHDGRTEFAYLLEWPNAEVMKDRWAKFLGDREWGDIKQASRSHGALVGTIEDRALTMTDYSPRQLLPAGR